VSHCRPTDLRLPILAMLLGVCLTGASGASGGEWGPQRPSREQRLEVNALLEKLTNQKALDEWVGAPPESCWASGPGVVLCEWKLSRHEPNGRELAVAIRTTKPMALMCALPDDGSERLASSCVARPRRSNRAEFSTSKVTPLHDYTMRDIRKRIQKLAQEWIDESRTMTTLSFLLGSVPTRCLPPEAGTQECWWHLDDSVYGQGTVATALGVRSTKKVRLRCTLPINGSPRIADSCEASEDD
jgi:hypothetical protein